MTLDEFLDKVCQRPLPKNPMAQVRTLAKELAEGASERIWVLDLLAYVGSHKSRGYGTWFMAGSGTNLVAYLSARWNDNYPELGLLISNDYLEWHIDTDSVRIHKNAFNLLEETGPSTIFISYRRSESSAFALLVLARLKQAGLEPFLDMALVPGEDWHDGLKERIQSRDYFILLVGKTTLESPYVVKEIQWALEKDMAILPIWQPEFDFQPEKWPDLPDAIKHKLSNTHTIRVLEENPLEYDKTLTELLNRFGVTP